MYTLKFDFSIPKTNIKAKEIDTSRMATYEKVIVVF